MEFKVFAKKLKNVIGGKSNTKIFTKTIFETMMNEIRNLYVKLHPNQFVGAFPYDAFIDDWNDGEY